MSESLRLLTKNERIAHSLIVGQKTNDSLGNPMSDFPVAHIPNHIKFGKNIAVLLRNIFSVLSPPVEKTSLQIQPSEMGQFIF